MNKYFYSILIGLVMSVPVYAQTVPDTNQQLVTILQQTITLILQEIKELQGQLVIAIAQQNQGLAQVNQTLGAIKDNTSPVLFQSATPVQPPVQTPVVSNVHIPVKDLRIVTNMFSQGKGYYPVTNPFINEDDSNNRMVQINAYYTEDGLPVPTTVNFDGQGFSKSYAVTTGKGQDVDCIVTSFLIKEINESGGRCYSDGRVYYTFNSENKDLPLGTSTVTVSSNGITKTVDILVR